MQSDPLESARAKIDRAKYHLRQLNDEIHADGNAKKYGVTFRHESQTDHLVMNALIPRDLFVHYSIIVGEIVGHARSALEHAVWEMVPSPDPGRTGFPIFTAETKIDAAAQGKDRYYNRDGLRMIDGINSAAEAIIRRSQPFGANYQTSLLYILNELWKVDKHRLLNTCIAFPQGASLIYTFPDGRVDASKFVTVPPDVKDGTELFRERHPGPNVNVIAEVAISGIVFDGGLVNGKPVPELLLKLIEFSDGIISDLAKTI